MSSSGGKILIVGITPYFLERGVLWFKENFQKVLEARKTQSFWQDNTLLLEKDQKFPLMEFLRKLDELGYEKVQSIEKPGEFSHLGNIIDIFPINLKGALRLEFLGNKIENIESLEIEIEDEEGSRKLLQKKLKLQKEFSGLKNLKPGDYLVHLDHGIAQFSGIEKSKILNPKSETNPNYQNTKSQTQDYYALKYAAGDKLYVPLGLERKLSRYIGFTIPKIHRLGSLAWQKTKKRIKEETEKLAKELLEIYAKRETVLRPPYLEDDELQKELEASFQYLETPDQLKAIAEIKKDMTESEKPMDRIVCGDVGFGKTEVALRAMVKCVLSGGQAMLITPTTILCEQHFQTFKTRLEKLPIKIAMLSRLQSKKEQKEVIEGLKSGKFDIVIGTHRLLSKDVEFSASTLRRQNYGAEASEGCGKNLRLAVIDEEQRFGVKQKERLKKMREAIDILSLSATPIPRSLYLSLSNLRNISLILTPPSQRLPIKTFILPFKEIFIKRAIENELRRNGQVYYLHNRVESIEMAKNFIEKLVPKAKTGIAHGRLPEQKLIETMLNFRKKGLDVLIATTIIENGLDLPNVNTLIVADSTRLGLSQAYQLRGRIGRGDIQALSYFLYPERLSFLAQKRLKALKEAESLGSGYQIALKDLELRGAGNILGKEQSGHVNSIGLNLYCQMLSESMEKLKSDRQTISLDNIPFGAKLLKKPEN